MGKILEFFRNQYDETSTLRCIEELHKQVSAIQKQAQDILDILKAQTSTSKRRELSKQPKE